MAVGGVAGACSFRRGDGALWYALQGKSGRSLGRRAALLGLFVLSGCASGYGLKQAEGDRDLITGSVPTLDRNDPSDETTIRNAVTSADIAALAGRPIAWANRDTGANGAIEAVAEFEKGGRVCRSFNASRENYEGVHLFSGQACLEDGVWRMTAFEAL